MVLVSVIVPVHNAQNWLEEAILSAATQVFPGTLEISAYNDASCDRSAIILEDLAQKLVAKVERFVISGHQGQARGCGFAKNRAIEQSRGDFLCFLDSDDVMVSGRIEKQLAIAVKNPNCIIGSQFHRHPPSSTPRFVSWANSLSEKQLTAQIYTSHGPTLVMPTWFMHRRVFDRVVGGFNESVARGHPEDLEFFYRHLDAGGGLAKVEEDLLMYRYHPDAATFSVHEDTIFRMRLDRLVAMVLPGWPSFTIWNAGKQGRRFYRSLPAPERAKVAAFCDVDAKKLRLGWYTHEESSETPKPKIPIVHFTAARPPLIVCAKLDLTGGQLEANLASLGLAEGLDYHWFS